MPTDLTPSSAVLTTRFVSLAALLAVVVGVLVLVGWTFEIAALKSVLPGLVEMKANTAVCFILIGVALWLTASHSISDFGFRISDFGKITPRSTFRIPHSAIFLAHFCLLLAGLIGLLTLAEYIFGWNPGIDQWLFIEPPGAVGTSDPGRMAPETALCFVLLAAALWITGGSRHIRKSTRTRWIVLAPVLLGLLVTTLALAAGLSYPTPGLGAYGWFGLTIMAIHTAILFVMLGVAVMAISWRQDFLQWSLGRNTTVAFACGMAVLVLVGFNINRSQFWMGEIDRKIASSVEAQDYVESIVIEVIDAQAHTRGYVITGDELFKARYLEAKANSNMSLDALRKLVAGNPRQQQQFARIEAQAVEQLQWFQQVIDARQTGMADATRNSMIRHGEGLLDNFRITYSQVKNEHQQLIKELRQQAERVSRFSYITIAAGTLASLLIFLTVMFRLNFAVNVRKRAEELLQNMAAKFHTLFELSSDAIMLLDGKSFFDCNPATLRIFGCTTREDFISKHPAEFSPPTQPHGEDSMSLANQHIATAFKNGNHLFEWMHRRLDGAEFPAEVLLTAMELDGKPVLQATVRDITERKQAEDSLRKLSLAVEQSPNSIDITDLDANIEYVNETFVKTSGYSVAELIGQNPRLLQSGKTPRATYDDMWAHLTRGEIWKGEFNNRRKDGSEYIESALVSPVRQADGRVTHYLAIKEDVTEFRQAQEALRDSHENLRRLLNSMAEGAYGVDTKGNCTFVNRAFLQMLGYQHENEVLGKHIHELIHHSHADGSPYPDSECRVYRAYRTNQSSNVSDEVFWRKDGIAIPVEYWSYPIETDGAATGAIVTFVDITERKRAEDQLRESEEKFSKMFESNPAMVAIGTLDGTMVDFNLSYANFLGFSREEMLGKSLADLGIISAAELQRLLELGQRVGESLRNVEVTLRARGGNLLNALLSAEIITLSGVRYRLATLQDITERKRIEEVLRTSEMEFHTLAEAMPQIVWITRPDGWNIYFNQHWMDYTGLTLEESLGHGWNKPFHPDDQQHAWDAWQKATATNGIYSIESRLRRADGVYRWWLVRGVPLLDADGNILKWFGTCTDIHDLKMAGLEVARAYGELRESERRFSDLLGNIELVSMMLDREARITYCNDHLLRLTGWKREEVIGKNWWDIFVPPELNVLKDAVFAKLLDKQPEALHYESEILTRSGERRLIHWNNSVLLSGDGDVIGSASIGEDITERKQLEQDKERYLKFFVLSINPMCIADPYGRFMRVNPAFSKLTGYSESELIAKPFLDFVLPEDRQRTEDEMKQQVENRSTLNFENRYLSKDGSVIDLSWTAYYDKQGGITYATAIDITERKQTEATLAEQLDELRRWYEATSGREARVLDLKHEVNELLAQTGQSPRYPSAEADDKGHSDV